MYALTCALGSTGAAIRGRLLVGPGRLHPDERLPLGGASLAQTRGRTSLQTFTHGEFTSQVEDVLQACRAVFLQDAIIMRDP